MTKLVLVLAVVVVVILVVVIVAVRNMRSEDPDEFADQADGRARARADSGDRNLGNRRRESAARQPARSGRGTRPGAAASGRSAAGRQASGSRSAATGRGYDERRDQPPSRGYRRSPDGADYDADRDFDQRDGRPYHDRRSVAAASGPQRRRPSDGMEHRPEIPAPARSRRRSGDSSEWDSSEWDQLSDVDYWAELASQKPMTSDAEPEPVRPARNGAARHVQDLETETMAVPSAARAGAPRRDPVTGLPARGPQSSDAELTAAVGRTDLFPAPVPADQPQDRRRPAAASHGDRGSRHHRRPAGSRNGDGAQTSRQLPPPPPAAPAGDRGQRLLDAPGRDSGRYLDVGPASLPMPAIRDVPRARPAQPRELPAHPLPAAAPPAAQPPAARRHRPAALDDDPLTSPSFPKVPAADSRSYRGGRADTPPNGSRSPGPYPSGTPQLPGYDAPAPPYPGSQYPSAQYPSAQYPTAQYSSAQYPTAQYPEMRYPEAQYPTAQYPTAPEPAAPPAPTAPAAPRRSGQHSTPRYPDDDGLRSQNGYQGDPLSSRNPYPAPAANGSSGSASTQPARGPVTPASGNPYGSYVTPDSRPALASGYNGYPTAPANGHSQPYPEPAAPATGDNGNGYWDHQAQVSQPNHADGAGPDYRNGYGQHGQAGYPPNGYPAGPDNRAGYPPADPYGSDGYGGYPEYGAAGR